MGTRLGPLLLAIAAFHAQAAGASVLCKSSRGNLLVRDACRPREQTLTPQAVDDLGLRGPAGPVGPTGPPGGGLHLVDANGSDVGRSCRSTPATTAGRRPACCAR